MSTETLDSKTAPGHEDVIHSRADGIANTATNRPEVRDAFPPRTVTEMPSAFADARADSAVGAVIL